MIDTTLAKRYATALVEIAQEQNALDKYAEDLDSLSKLVGASRDFREVLINPVFTKEDKMTWRNMNLVLKENQLI